MTTTRSRKGPGCASDAAIQTLVISQHDVVRQQLVHYLSRSPNVHAAGAAFSLDAIRNFHPDVLVLDLSQLDYDELVVAIDAADEVGARLIALASLRDADTEALVLQAGGHYQLKAAGANGLAELVRGAKRRMD
ncbi:MAG: hypothetical protein AB7P40_15780 [Chloroflexota bacterium]